VRPDTSCAVPAGRDFAALTSQPQHWHVTLFHTARLGDARPDALTNGGGVDSTLQCPSVRNRLRCPRCRQPMLLTKLTKLSTAQLHAHSGICSSHMEHVPRALFAREELPVLAIDGLAAWCVDVASGLAGQPACPLPATSDSGCLYCAQMQRPPTDGELAREVAAFRAQVLKFSPLVLQVSSL
jgi:hypothetical protein